MFISESFEGAAGVADAVDQQLILFGAEAGGDEVRHVVAGHGKTGVPAKYVVEIRRSASSCGLASFRAAGPRPTSQLMKRA